MTRRDWAIVGIGTAIIWTALVAVSWFAMGTS